MAHQSAEAASAHSPKKTPAARTAVLMDRTASEEFPSKAKINNLEAVPHSKLMARTNVAVDRAVFDEFSAVAKRQNKTVSAFASEALLAAVKVSNEGGNPSDLYRTWRSLSLLKQLDAITLPSDFVDDLVAKQYAADKTKLLRMFSDLGSRLVGALKIGAADLDELEELAKDFAALLPIKQFKITNNSDGSVEVGIVGAGRRIESTECSVEFLVSILNGYGYHVTKREINVGTIKLVAAKRSSL